MSKKIQAGPTDNKCTGCPFHDVKRLKSDSNSHDNYCNHSLAPNSLRKLTPLHTGNGAFIGYDENTPKWCPELPVKKKLRGTSIMSTKQ